MRSKRWTVTVIGALALSPVLGACGGSDDPDDDARDVDSSQPVDRSSDAGTGDPTPAETTESAGMTPAPGGGAVAACDLLGPEDVASAYGVTPGTGAPGGGGYSEQGVEWQTDNCDFEAEDLMEVELAVAGADDFPAGFTCPPQTEIVATVQQAKVAGADSASWKVSDGDGAFEGELRFCTADRLFEISVDFEDGYQHEGDPKAQTIGLAEVVLERVG